MLKKILILAAILVALIGLYAISGFYLLPRLATDKLPKLLTEMSGRTVQLQTVHFDPFELKAELQGGDFPAADGKALLSFEALSVDVDLIESVKQKSLIVANLTLRKPVGNIERGADGRFNFSDLVDKVSASGQEKQDTSESGAPPVLIHQISLEEGQISWSDASSGQRKQEALLPVNLSISELATLPDNKAAFNLSLKLASGGGLDIQGDLALSALGSQGHVNLDGVGLTQIWRLFLQEAMPLESVDGQLSLQADYVFGGNQKSGLQVLVSNGSVVVKQLGLTEKSKDAHLIDLPLLAVNGINLDLQKQQLGIASVASSDANIKAWLQADGQVNYQALFTDQTVEGSSQAEPAVAESSPPWQIQLDALALSNYRIEFTDHSQVKPVEMVLSELNCTLKDYRNADAIRVPLEFSARFNQSGSLKFGGDLGLSPFSANWALDMRAIKLKTFQTYVDPFVRLELVDGELNTQGNLRLSMADAIQVNYQGDANIDSLITRDKAKNQDFVKWANLELKQMVIDVPKQDYKLAKVIFDQPYARFMIKKDGTNNISDILVAKTSAKSSAKNNNKIDKENGKAAEPVVTIGNIELKQGQSDFADYSLILPFVVKMNDLSGEVDGFASNSDNAAKLKLQGKVHDLASVKIQGNYQFQSSDSDIVLNFSHLPLPLVTPYMAEFAGYRIEKGQMALDLKYTIKDSQLTAQNKIFIDQLVLGEKVENPKAVSLPLELAVALLKDGDGKINLDFPITGSLEDPKFSVGSLVADVMVNVISKAVSAPFKAIASLFDSEADLSTISFAAGSAELSPEEIAKLDVIVKALTTKPELVLEIKGVAYEVRDWPVMRFDALTDILK